MRREGNIFYPAQFQEWAKKKERVEDFLKDIEESFISFLPFALEMLKKASDDRNKFFVPAEGVREPFETDIKFTKAYLYFVQFKEPWERKIGELIMVIKNEKLAGELLERLLKYQKNMRIELKYFPTEGDVIQAVEEFVKKWKKI